MQAQCSFERAAAHALLRLANDLVDNRPEPPRPEPDLAPCIRSDPDDPSCHLDAGVAAEIMLRLTDISSARDELLQERPKG